MQAIRHSAFTELTTSVTDHPDGPAYFSVIGELDIATAGAFGTELVRTIDDQGPHVVVDVSALAFCDARGLAALHDADEHARSLGGSVTLTGVRPHLAKILRITGLDHRFLRTP